MTKAKIFNYQKNYLKQNKVNLLIESPSGYS